MAAQGVINCSYVKYEYNLAFKRLADKYLANVSSKMASGGLDNDGSLEMQGGGDVEQKSHIFTLQPDVTGEGEYTAMVPLTCDGDGCGKQEDVVWYCKNCPCSLCDSCKKTHEASRMSRNHTILPRTGEVVLLHKFTSKREQCRIHDQEHITMYCYDCKAPFCSLCIEQHRRHVFSPIEKVLSQTTCELANKLAEMEEITEETLLSDRNAMSKLLQYSEKIKDKAILNIEEEKEMTINKLSEIYDEKLRALDENYAEEKRKLEAKTKSRNESSKRKLQQYRETLQRGGTDMIELTARLTNQDSFSDTIIHNFKYPVFFSASSLESQLEDLETGHVQLVSMNSTDISVVAQFELQNCCTSLKLGKTANSVEGCIETGGYLVFDKDKFKVVETSTCPKEWFDFVRTKHDEILFSDRKSIWKMLPDGNVKLHIEEDSFYTQGLCINNKDQIVVCMDQVCVSTSHLSVYSADGQKKLMEIRHDIDGEIVLNHSRYVIQNGDDYCVVNHGGTVVVFDMSGSYKWMYGNFVPPGCRARPTLRCISNDSLYNIYIADGINKCIHFLNKDGNFLSVITRQQSGIYPSIDAMVVDSARKQIWTVNGGKNVTVLSYQPLRKTEDDE